VPMAMRLCQFIMYHTFSAAVSHVDKWLWGGILLMDCERSSWALWLPVRLVPTSNFTSVAMKAFKLTISLFERMAPQSQRAKIALVGPFFCMPVVWIGIEVGY
jgi:hypothetical protein